MCERPVVVAVAHPLVARTSLVIGVVAGSGIALRAMSGDSALAWVTIGAFAWAALVTIALIAKMASPVRAVAPRSQPVRAPAHTTAVRVIEARPVQALPAATATPETLTTATSAHRERPNHKEISMFFKKKATHVITDPRGTDPLGNSATVYGKKDLKARQKAAKALGVAVTVRRLGRGTR
ncbi:hypothetical protein [Streptosporangium roseum]|uniref:hypothetical protein n=1 Tax=Streptosporangium roseum TaxID=2001 RepID=UPI003330DA9D